MPFSATNQRIFEWGLVAILIFVLVAGAIYYIRQLEREVRWLLVESLERTLSVQLFITQQQMARRGQTHNPEYVWQIDEHTYITVGYGYPAANDTRNITHLFEPLATRWNFELDASGIIATLDGRTGCGIFYRPALDTQTPAMIEIFKQGC